MVYWRRYVKITPPAGAGSCHGSQNRRSRKSKWIGVPHAKLEDAQKHVPAGNFPLTEPMALGLPQGSMTYVERYGRYGNTTRWFGHFHRKKFICGCGCHLPRFCLVRRNVLCQWLSDVVPCDFGQGALCFLCYQELQSAMLQIHFWWQFVWPPQIFKLSQIKLVRAVRYCP